MSSVITFPIPPYSNVPIRADFFKPRRFEISNVSLGTFTTVTTIFNMDYVIGQECRLIIPKGYGCTELNEVTGLVIEIPADNQVVLDINSSNANQFVNANRLQVPQILAIGDVNTGHINPNGPKHTHSHIPGSFRNISPV